MNDITALMQKIKAAAITVARDGRTDDEWFYYLQCAHHKNVLALVEALEKAQQRTDELENDEVRQRLANAERQLHMAGLRFHNIKASRNAQFKKRKAAERRIAELESRTVTVKLPRLKQTESGERYVWSDGIFNYRTDVIEILRAAGILVIEGES